MYVKKALLIWSFIHVQVIFKGQKIWQILIYMFNLGHYIPMLILIRNENMAS